MKIVLTCGHYQSDYRAAHGLLVKAGLAEASPSRRESLSPADLQAQIFKYYDQNASALDDIVIVRPGDLWRNVAVDLLTANLDRQNWGWADPRTLSLLDFWQQLDSQIRFLLVYCAPEYAVARMLANEDASPESIAHAVRSWSNANTQVINFYHRHPDRCILANETAFIESPREFVAHVAGEWALDLASESASSTADHDPLAIVGARILKPLVSDMHDVMALYHELESVAHIGVTTENVEPAHIRRAWHQHAQSTRKSGELQLAHAQLTKAHDEQKKLAAEAQRVLKTMRPEAEVVQLEERLRGLGQEHELLLLQLGQAQEELEQHHKQSKQAHEEHARRANELQQQLGAVTKQRDEQSKRADELQRQLGVITKQRDEQTKLATEVQLRLKTMRPQADVVRLEEKLKDLGQEHELLHLQLGQAQEELEQHQLQLKQARDEHVRHADELQRQVAQLTRHTDELAKARDEHMKAARAAQGALNGMRPESEFKEFERRCEELAGDNELLQLQLRQVQEELDHYYLKNKELTQSSANASSWSEQQPHTMLWDMRGDVAGENWYYAEEDGRWAGPGLFSTVRLPRLRDGSYEMELDVVDAMAPEILTGMELAVNGHPISVESGAFQLPMVVRARFSTREIGNHSSWALQFKFPNVISPADHGSDDQRSLGIRLRALKLTLTDLLQ